MTTVTYQRRAGRTGRPLGIIDVVAKLIETAFGALRGRIAPAATSATAEAAAVRRLADRQRRISPGFASDLYAAADRHEREHAG